MPHARKWGAIASRGVANLPTGTRRPTPRRRAEPVAPGRRTSHVCSVGCDCGARAVTVWTREVAVPVTLRRDQGVTYATGGGTRTVPTADGEHAWGRLMSLITPGRPSTGRPVFLDAERAARARTGTQTSDPIVMPDDVTVRKLDPGVTYHARRQDADGNYVGELKERIPESPFIVASQTRNGDTRIESANKSGWANWGRKWGVKSNGARPFRTSSLPNGSRNPRR